MDNQVIKNLANELNLQENQIIKTLEMLEEGSTVAFISRYRKEITNGLDEETINEIAKSYKYNLELSKRKEAIIEILKERDLLNDDLLEKINSTKKKNDLEAIYEPFKIGKKTKASEAINLGLEPLAKIIFTSKNRNINIKQEAKKFVNDKVKDEQFAIEQALFIVSQWLSQNVNIREYVLDQFNNYGQIVTKLKKNAEDPNQVFKNYYDFKIPVKFIQDFKVMAINRAINLKIIDFKIDINVEIIKKNLSYNYAKNPALRELNNLAIEDSLKRLILPSIEREVFSNLFERAELKSIELFAKNIENVLMAPAVKNKKVLAVDPAYVHGCKLAYLDEKGNLLKTDIFYPNPPLNKTKEAYEILKNIILNNQVDVIVVGNGTASNETIKFIKKSLEKLNIENISVEMVSEVGASVYSASEIAAREFPDLSVEMRSAINIGRKFIDPLNEIVKIDPKSIGVGQYQHDLNQKQLSEALDFKVIKVVNAVGINLNTATKEILTYVSGLSEKTAQNIIDYRQEIKTYTNRKQLLKVKGLGAKTFEQAVGFLRIFDSEEFLDKTNIHPESYELAKQIMKDYSYDINTNKFKIELPNVDELTKEYNSNNYLIDLIIEALQNPTKDIRDTKKGFKLSNISDIEDLKIDECYYGRIQNITDFGVFIFIGIKDSVFVHLSNIKNTNINELAINTDVKVKIISIDKELKRISGEL
ncbi:Tex-like N-terminal domain-containing protein [Mycoplasmopsis ciconiae]|uniref:Tex-like N-terminal domain-containing protein n=1 Tax=Mycoplasmopsis ciconiae TaxID=561067 RepID=A0ABU7MKR8_9BACT|nr:Tex-like N-terminal domain-containing protein [Mycoplasmopsis ciconiae]